MKNEIPDMEPEEGWALWRARQTVKTNPTADKAMNEIISRSIVENAMQYLGNGVLLGAGGEIAYMYFVSHADGFAYILPVAVGAIFGILKMYVALRWGRMRRPKE